MRHLRWWIGAAVLLVTATWALWPGTRPAQAPGDVLNAQPRRTASIELTDEARLAALRRARVWRPAHDRSRTTLVVTDDPRHTFSASPLECRFQPEVPHGTTPKFSCVLADGDVVKVKYGTTSEIPAEIAASRLLSVLGFGADDMFLVPRVRCYGCPRRPFELSWVADRFHLRDVVMRRFPPQRYVDFEWAAVERRFPAPAIETPTREGWAWYELDAEDPSDPHSRAERDALRLAAMLLTHWDNKAENQRFTCLDSDVSNRDCAHPFAMIHDLGSTFGPRKTEIDAWATRPVFKDAARCVLSMRDYPYGGGTFPDWEIGEGGRQLLLAELRSISEADARDWLEAARFDQPERWAAAFMARVQQIAMAGPCLAGDEA
ncbi:MAG TPA: hypothetical protein VM032_08615 [Vicinamibacterales bacterium]|nr:hypothetical protein [Vicinamibacterales bacterium]